MTTRDRVHIVMWITFIAVCLLSLGCATSEPEIIRDPYPVIELITVAVPDAPVYELATMTPAEIEAYCADVPACLGLVLRDHGRALADSAKLRAILRAINDR